MNIVLVAIAALLAPAGAAGASSLLQARVDEACPDLRSECGLVDADDCAFERPERPVRAEMTREEFAAHRSRAAARRETMLACICCDRMSVDDVAALPLHKDGSADGPAGRGFGRHRHHGGRGFGHPHDGRGKEHLQARVDEMCPDFRSECGLVDDDDCTFEKPARPDRASMTEEEKNQHWSEVQARRERMLQCICCDRMSVEDAAALRPGGRGKGAEGRGFKGHHKGDHKGDHRGEHEGGRGRPSPEKIQAELDEECPTFDCDGEGVEELKADCTWFDAVMAGEDPPAKKSANDGEREGPGERHHMRGGRGGDRWEHWKNKRLSCGCCRGE